MCDKIIRCTLSGSFRKDRAGLQSAYAELVTCGCQVLSPHRLDFDDPQTLFVRDASENDFSELELEKHHLLSIAQSDFLWVHAPDGYIGTSTAFEIGYAVAQKITIFSSQTILDTMLGQFVQRVPSVFRALELLESKQASSKPLSAIV